MSQSQRIETVAIVGAGVVGRGWLPVFIGGGCKTRIYDPDPAQSQAGVEWCKAFVRRRVEQGDLSAQAAEQSLQNLSISATLEDAVADAQYVQESIPEVLAIKHDMFARLDQLTGADVILASSTSSMDIAAIAAGLKHPGRCVTVHPFNPAAILPAVEILATPQAEEGFLGRVEAFLALLGQKPVRMNRFATGYIGNRLQLALMREAFHIVESGLASTEAIDTVLSDALALRWALLGTFGTNHTNADQGIRSYYQIFGSTLKVLMDDLPAQAPAFDADMIERFGRELDQRFKDTELAELRNWRDDLVCQIRKLKHSTPLK